ncbi:FliH/SctL family protein [Pseudoduganella violacea]|uniref:Flagellar biosynthesis/type III secretory pathway protein FliH n=1 Tax=Pseudoduganella violacea TaxID=1715466 RepID=A0A7W5BEY2_9BURK|nr:flagellar biosynthesis/type III secretory pathway protein [Pseudoduganella violacea]MBB3121932.1 flagellar biosynthesis/type III secretory pathway protein FliH [Pseudoduganella violacea]
MKAFCAARMSTDPRLLPSHGVLHASTREMTADAQLLAERIVEQGRAEAAQLLAEAQVQARHAVQAAETRVLEQGVQLQQGMEAAMADLLEQAQDIVLRLAAELYDRLMLETAPQEKIAAACRRLLREAPPKLVNAVLRLHPGDMPAPDGTPWPCKADPELAPGCCRLEADSGEWRADFNAAAASLRQALAVLPPPAAEPDMMSDATPDAMADIATAAS